MLKSINSKKTEKRSSHEVPVHRQMQIIEAFAQHVNVLKLSTPEHRNFSNVFLICDLSKTIELMAYV